MKNYKKHIVALLVKLSFLLSLLSDITASEMLSTDQYVESFYYRIKNYHNDVLDSWGNETDFVGQYFQHSFNHNDIDKQLWQLKPVRFEDNSGQYYQIVSVHTGKSLDSGNDDDQLVKKLPVCESGTNYEQLLPQLWKIEDTGIEKDGISYKYIISVRNGKVLDHWINHNMGFSLLGKWVTWVGKNNKITSQYLEYKAPQAWSIQPILLNEAILEHRLDMLRILLEQGHDPAEIDKKDKYKRTSIHIAAEKDELDALNILLENRDSRISDLLTVRDIVGNTPFHTAAYYGSMKVLNELIRRYPQGQYMKGEFGYKPIHTAVSQGRFDPVEFLYANANQADLIDDSGNTPLHVAQFKCFDKIINYLIDISPHHVFKISSRSWWGTPIHFAATFGLINQLEKFVQKLGKEVFEYKDHNDNTPLISAIVRNQEAVVRYLIDHGVNIYTKCKFGGTAFHCAAEHDKHILSILTKYSNQRYPTINLNILDIFAKMPINLIKMDVGKLNGKQVRGNKGVTHDNCHVTLFFKRSTILDGVELPHAHIAFERLKNLNEINEEGEKNLTDLQIVHLNCGKEYSLYSLLYGDSTIKILEGRDAHIYINNNKNLPYNIFSWSINRDQANNAWSQIRMENNKSRTFSLLPNFGWGENCFTFVVDEVLKTFDITFPQTLYDDKLIKIKPEKLINFLNRYSS